jgi:hypothetical protein
MGWSPNHKRIKEKYNPRPNAQEARHEAHLYDLPCIGCGRFGVELHHTMTEFPEKRWRRDHRFQLPVCPDCHRGPQGIHGIGDEALWAESVGLKDTGLIAKMLWEDFLRHDRRAA